MNSHHVKVVYVDEGFLAVGVQNHDDGMDEVGSVGQSGQRQEPRPAQDAVDEA